MRLEKFVNLIREEAIDDEIQLFREILAEDDRNVTDPYWRNVRSLVAKLKPSDVECVLSIVRQVSVDATAVVLGILDGTCCVTNEKMEIRLEVNGQVYSSGELQEQLFIQEQKQ